MGGKNNPETTKTYYEKNKKDIRLKQKIKYFTDKKHRESAKTRTKEWYANNIKKANSYSKDWWDKNKEANLQKSRDRHTAILEIMAARSKPSCCDVCKKENVKIVFDHAHYTEHFRGWICDGCNKALGAVLDNPDVLENLALYIRKYDNENDSAGLRNDYYKAKRKIQRLQSLLSYKQACKYRMECIREQCIIPGELPISSPQ